MLRNLERAGGILALRLRVWEPKRSVQGTEVQGVAQVTRSCAPETGTQDHYGKRR
jgi:hypothetical protein